MLDPKLIVSGWILHLFTCFYLIRFMSNAIIRCILTLTPCVVLTYIVGYDLPALQMTSMLLITYCWLVSIRLFHLIVLSPNECSNFRSYILKILWMCFPIVPCTSYEQQHWPIFYDIVSASVKLILNHWIYRWLLTCNGSDSYARLIMFSIFVLTYTFLSEMQSVIVRIVTRDKYMLKSLTNFPLLSVSLREFWGRRYNQLIGTIFRESIFKPVLQRLSSPTISALLVFIVSGLLHIHLAYINFQDHRAAASNMLFFLLHGVACTIEAHIPFRLPAPVTCLLTQIFILATIYLQIGPFTKLGPDYYLVNAPPLFDLKWIPALSVPNFCPK